MRIRIVSLSLVSILTAVAGMAARSDAGCGCQKPPPVASVIRPNFATPGSEITLTHPQLVVGQSYAVTFARNGRTETVAAFAVSQRDRADAQIKPQLVVGVPPLGAGPASISVRGSAASTVLFTVPDADFTVLTDALAIPAARGAWTFAGTQAAVSRAGVVYLALDLSGLQEPLIFEAQAAGYPLRFGAEDVVFYNSQGYLMQLLVSGDTVRPIPGMFVKPAALPLLQSDVLHYSRHEFATYFLQHEERQAHAVDAAGWHADGTPHIDHNQLIIAIHGRTALGVPAAGVTPPFELKVKAESIFSAGLVGTEKVEVKDTAQTDSYDGGTMVAGHHGDVVSHRDVLVKDASAVLGSVTGAKITRDPLALIDGVQALVPTPQTPTLMAVSVPSGLTSLGKIELKGRGHVIEGPGSFRVDLIKLDEGATLVIDNTAGPVTLYVSGEVLIEKGSEITVVDPRAERFAIYLSGDKPVKLAGDGTLFSGVVYAPRSNINITGSAEFSGAFVGKDVKLEQSGRVHYDSSLRRAD